MGFAYQTALDLTPLIAARNISPVKLVEDVLQRQEALEPTPSKSGVFCFWCNY